MSFTDIILNMPLDNMRRKNFAKLVLQGCDLPPFLAQIPAFNPACAPLVAAGALRAAHGARGDSFNSPPMYPSRRYPVSSRLTSSPQSNCG